METSTKSFKAADIARVAGVHPSTVKRISDEIDMKPEKTPRGHRRWSYDQAVTLISEIERRVSTGSSDDLIQGRGIAAV